jgi:hypothetical protein
MTFSGKLLESHHRKSSRPDISSMHEKITLFTLTVVDIFDTKQLVCDNHHQVFCSHLILVHRTKWQHLRLLGLPVALSTKELRVFYDRTSLA